MMKLTEAIALFLGEYTNVNTRRTHTIELRMMAEFIGPARTITAVKHADVHLYVHQLDIRPIAPATRYKHVKTIKRFFKWLVEIEVLKRSPAAKVKQNRLTLAVDRKKAMTDQELELLLKAAFGHTRNFALIKFIADTGCRVGGVAALLMERLDLENLRAIVTEKGNKSRPVWFSEETAAALRRWLIERDSSRDNPYVFPGEKEGHLSAPSIGQMIRRHCKRAGIRSLGPHSLRHRKGHQLADAKEAVTIAAAALGHSPEIYMAYYAPNDYERAEKAIRQTHDQPEVENENKILRLKWGR